MAIPYVPTTHSDGQSWTAAKANLLEIAARDAHLMPAVRVFHNAAQSLTSGVEATLAFNSERFDQASGVADTQHDNVTNNSRLTCRYAGVYQITGNVQFANNATGLRWVRIRHSSGSTIIAHTSVPSGLSGTATRLSVSTLYSLAVNEYVELLARQDSGGALDVETSGNASPEFMMVRVA